MTSLGRADPAFDDRHCFRELYTDFAVGWNANLSACDPASLAPMTEAPALESAAATSFEESTPGPSMRRLKPFVVAALEMTVAPISASVSGTDARQRSSATQMSKRSRAAASAKGFATTNTGVPAG